MSLINANNFIFIHIYKCGGMSLRKHITDNLNSKELHLSHSTAKEMRDYCYSNGGQFFWHTAFKFSIVRNPFDWVVSLYEFIKGNPSHENHEEVKEMDFKQFCKWNVSAINDKKTNVNGKLNTLTEFLFDGDKLLVDFVGKLENIDEDFKVICSKLGIKNEDIPHINETKGRKKDYREYYDEESKDIITKGFYYDLVNFNYTF